MKNTAESFRKLEQWGSELSEKEEHGCVCVVEKDVNVVASFPRWVEIRNSAFVENVGQNLELLRKEPQNSHSVAFNILLKSTISTCQAERSLWQTFVDKLVVLRNRKCSELLRRCFTVFSSLFQNKRQNVNQKMEKFAHLFFIFPCSKILWKPSLRT